MQDTKKIEQKGGQGVDSQQKVLLSRSAEGATFLILLQVGSRALTFGLNQILLRYLSPELLAISSQLEVFSISALYFSRESLRIAGQRQQPTLDVTKARTGDVPRGYVDGDSPAGRNQGIVNISYISIFLGVPFIFALSYFYLATDGPALRTPFFKESLGLYGIAAFVELLTEPCFLIVQQNMLYKVRASAESVATCLRCVVTCLLSVYSSRIGADVGSLPFAVGQMTYAVILVLIYYGRLASLSSTVGFSFFLKRIFSRHGSQYILFYFPRSVLALASSIFIQSGIKHILTYGDTLLINIFASLKDQGAYALAANYGGLIARMVFQPIEESGRNLFSTLLSNGTEKPSKPNVESGKRILRDILRLYSLISLLAIAFGPTIAPLLLRVVAGERWSSSNASDVLSTYCLYIPLLAINGITEAFISSVASSKQVHRQSVWMFGFSVCFATAGYIFLRVLELGAEGLVWANLVNMLLRILWSLNFIQTYLVNNGTSLTIVDVLPTLGSIASTVAGAACMKALKSSFRGGLGDLLKSGLLAVPFSLAM